MWKHDEEFSNYCCRYKKICTIFSPDVSFLLVKTVRNNTEALMSDYITIPEQISEKMKTVGLTVDVMFINNILFMISLSINVKFTTMKTWCIRKGLL